MSCSSCHSQLIHLELQLTLALFNSSQAYIEFSSPQAATAVKRKIETFSEGQPTARKHLVSFASPATNPYRTLPKDAPARQNVTGHQNRSTSGSFGGTPTQTNYNSNGNFRARR